jgi:hypothetical protein
LTFWKPSRHGLNSGVNLQILDELVEVCCDPGGRNNAPSRRFHFGEFQGLQTITPRVSQQIQQRPLFHACLPIFEDDQDREAFLAIVQEAVNWLCYAHCV